MPTTIPPVTTTVTTTRPFYPGKAQHGTGVMKARVVGNSRRAVRRFGTKAEGYIKAKAPVDTGYMKSKVGHEVDDDGFGVDVFVDGWKSAEIGAFYAVYVEFGTRHMAAQPFFWPGIAQARREFVAEMMRVFQ